MRTAALVFLFALALAGILVRPEAPPKRNGLCAQLEAGFDASGAVWSVEGPEGAAFFPREGYAAPELCVTQLGIYKATATKDGRYVGSVTIEVKSHAIGDPVI